MPESKTNRDRVIVAVTETETKTKRWEQRKGNRTDDRDPDLQLQSRHCKHIPPLPSEVESESRVWFAIDTSVGIISRLFSPIFIAAAGHGSRGCHEGALATVQPLSMLCFCLRSTDSIVASPARESPPSHLMFLCRPACLPARRRSCCFRVQSPGKLSSVYLPITSSRQKNTHIL